MADSDPLDVNQVASLLHLSRNTVYKLARSGELASYRIGRKLRFSHEDVQDYLQQAHGAMPSSADAGQTGRSISAHDESADPQRIEDDSFVLAGTVMAADLFANQLAACGLAVTRSRKNSYYALSALYEGTVDAAFVHLFDWRTRKYNVPFVQRLVPGLPVVVIRLYARTVGLIVPAGNPRGLTTWGGLLRQGVRVANQEKGSGARVLFDQRLIGMEAVPGTVDGYDSSCASSVLAARAVAAGKADVCLGTAHDAAAVDGVAFVPMQIEQVDVALAKTPRTRSLVRNVKALAADAGFVSILDALGADTRQTGAVLYEC